MESLFAAEASAVAGGGGGGYWQLALVLGGIGLLGLVTRWRKLRAGPPPSTAREFRARDEDPNRYRDAADRALVDLVETGREIGAQVDMKIRLLNRLVKDAEEKIARLEALLATTNGEDAVACGGGEKAGRKESPAPVAPEDAVERNAPRPSGEKRFMSELHERVYRLGEEGKSVAEIAKATNLSITEVRFSLEALGMTLRRDDDG